MSPLPIVTGILLGCSASITIGLGVVLFVFAPNMGERPQIQTVLPTAVESVAMFAVMTLICGLSFILIDPEARLGLARLGGHVVPAPLRVLLLLAGLIEDLVDVRQPLTPAFNISCCREP